MAILENGPNGGIIGKFGSVVGYKRYGKWIVRGLGKARRKKLKPSAKQKVCRNRFATVQKFLYLIKGFVRVSWRLEGIKRQMSAHNAAKSSILLNALDENGQIIYEKVDISFGSLVAIEGANVNYDEEGIHINWTDNSTEGNASSKDQLMYLLYDIGNEALPCFSAARRNEQYQRIPPTDFLKGKNYHLWLSFISDDRMAIATSTYLGIVNT